MQLVDQRRDSVCVSDDQRDLTLPVAHHAANETLDEIWIVDVELELQARRKRRRRLLRAARSRRVDRVDARDDVDVGDEVREPLRALAAECAEPRVRVARGRVRLRMPNEDDRRRGLLLEQPRETEHEDDVTDHRHEPDPGLAFRADGYHSARVVRAKVRSMLNAARRRAGRDADLARRARCTPPRSIVRTAEEALRRFARPRRRRACVAATRAARENPIQAITATPRIAASSTAPMTTAPTSSTPNTTTDSACASGPPEMPKMFGRAFMARFYLRDDQSIRR